jgi:hypothetical protein
MLEFQCKNWDGCPLYFVRARCQNIEREKRGGSYEREKQRSEGKQEGSTKKPQREEKDKKGKEKQVGWRVFLSRQERMAQIFVFH